MRKMLFFLLLGMPFVFNACNNGTQSSTATAPPASAEPSMAEKNLKSNQIVTKAFESGDASMIDSAVAADFVDHTDGRETNRDSLKAMIGMMKKMMPDMKTEVIKEVGDNDYVFTLMRFSGTSTGEMGMPKGTPYDFHATQVVRFKDGKAVEHWEYTQWQEMQKMMGQMQQPKKEDVKKVKK
jgi:predicted SnoaL-like aldol condensation-catalyzing enzyme